jgi:beta-carotene/zeaxanthin 4-ketolase
MEKGGSRGDGTTANPGRESVSGVLPAFLIIGLWAGHLVYALAFVPVPIAGETDGSVLTWLRLFLHLALQSYFYTGLFITAHDAMHGSASHNRRLNRWIGRVAAFLFAAFSYRKLHANHMKHHRWPGEARDPDFYPRSQNFLVWFVVFFYRYATVIQLVTMALLFNLLRLVVPTWNIIFFWVVPAFIATFQLFYFGTYRPHRYPHTHEMGPHHARSQQKNHFWAMLSCYFFGYHIEHHNSPGTPWWRLHELKDRYD